MVEVILLERVEKLGQMGDIVKVRPGFARNFLLPQKKALRATESNKKRFSEQRVQLEAVNLQRRQEAEKVAPSLDNMVVTLIRQAGETGQLFGSATTRDIADAVSAKGVTIGRQQVLLDRPIKELGLVPVRVVLHPEVSVTVTVNVARSLDEAEVQLKTGAAVVGERDEPDVDYLADEAAAEAAAQAVKEEPSGESASGKATD
ncbi:MAG: 50S ribosomal protein L9 [Rhodospirillaceae bacterium]|nr:50S ribosomal protein L9 [Rhodospirillaceae bacterium]